MTRRKVIVHARYADGTVGNICGARHATTSDNIQRITCRVCKRYVDKHPWLFRDPDAAVLTGGK